MEFKLGHYYKLETNQFTIYAVYERFEHLHILKDTDKSPVTKLTGQYIRYPNGETGKDESWKEISKDEFILEMI